MKLSTKAAIYSGIVFPGAGYFAVKKPIRGLVAALISLVYLGLVIVEAVHKAQIIAQDILNGLIRYDIASIRAQIELTPGIISTQALTLATIAIAIVWVVGIIDSYRIGKNIDLQNTRQNQNVKVGG